MPAYRSQYSVHKVVQLLGVHQAAALEDAHGELGDDGQVALEVLADDLAELFIVLERLDFLELAERVKGAVVQLVDLFDVSVRHHHVGELLHVADPMGDSVTDIEPQVSSWQQKELSAAVNIPDRELSPHVVCRADQSRLGQGAPKDHQLAQADGARLFGNPST